MTKPFKSSRLIFVAITITAMGLISYSVFTTANNHPKLSPTIHDQPVPTIDNGIVKSQQNSVFGTYLTDLNGRTLYTYDEDNPNQSECTDNCLTNWPIYTASASANLPDHIGVIQAETGESMYTWDTQPLYFYARDSQPGDITGDGIGGIWHVARP